MRMVAHRIADPRVLNLIKMWLQAGALESNELHETERGTPQGSGISPLLANIFLHYVLDLWVHQWRRRHARGRVSVVRYADNFVMGFESKADAQRMVPPTSSGSTYPSSTSRKGAPRWSSRSKGRSSRSRLT
jgi:retron-type reverse transcriptase